MMDRELAELKNVVANQRRDLKSMLEREHFVHQPFKTPFVYQNGRNLFLGGEKLDFTPSPRHDPQPAPDVQAQQQMAQGVHYVTLKPSRAEAVHLDGIIHPPSPKKKVSIVNINDKVKSTYEQNQTQMQQNKDRKQAVNPFMKELPIISARGPGLGELPCDTSLTKK